MKFLEILIAICLAPFLLAALILISPILLVELFLEIKRDLKT